MNEIPSITENDLPEAAPDASAEENIQENQDTSPDVTANESHGDSYDAEALTDDLIELRSRFPELQQIESVEELRGYKRYSELRALGLTPEEAYLATGKREAVHDNRAHLTSAVPIAASSPRGMSRRELGIARELFSDLSDSEIQSLYQRVTK